MFAAGVNGSLEILSVTFVKKRNRACTNISLVEQKTQSFELTIVPAVDPTTFEVRDPAPIVITVLEEKEDEPNVVGVDVGNGEHLNEVYIHLGLQIYVGFD